MKSGNSSLRLLTPADIPDAMRLKDAAGWNQTARDWQRFLSDRPDGCFAAEADGRLIGTSATTTYEDKLAWIGMVIVDRKYRARGIGTRLLEAAIQYLDSQGVPCMKLDATPQGKPLYEKLGFTCEYEIERWVLHRQPHWRAGESVPAGQNSINMDSLTQSLDEISGLDAQIFGANRSSLLRSVAREAPDFVQTVWQGATLAGYAYGRCGSHADHLGPWMAGDDAAAASLLDQFLQRSTREAIFVDCLKQNRWAIPLVKARGFELSRPLTRMFRGKNQTPGRPDRMCAILGPEFG